MGNVPAGILPVKQRKPPETFSHFPCFTCRARISEPTKERRKTKMKKGLAAGMAAALAVAIAVPAVAGNIGQRQMNQQRRIYQGVRSGSLTPGEAMRLERQQFRIERMERRLKADGNLTCRDRARIRFRQNQASRCIYRAKHNRRMAR
jgi:hypothetical protein